MRRRSIIAAIGGAAAIRPFAALRAATRPRVGFLSWTYLPADSPSVVLFRDRLRSLGDVEGQNFDIVFHFADTDNTPQVSAMTAEIVASRPDIIVVVGNPGIDAVRTLTRSIPIVAIFSGDPVPLGYSTNWSRPSGNITGIMSGLDTLSAKRIELLHELLPSALTFGLLYDPTSPAHRIVLDRTEAAIRSLRLELRRYPVGNGNEVEQVPARAVADHVAALIVASTPAINDHHAALIAAATALRLPTMHNFSFEAMDGAVVAYGTDQAWNWQRAADYLHRLLHGAQVSDLPFEENDHVVLTLNLRTAQAIGLEVPASIVARANEVIE